MMKSKVNWGLEDTSDSWKLHNSAWHPFYSWVNYNKNASTRSGSNIIFDCVRPGRVFVKNPAIKWMPRRVLEFPWISEVQSNPQLTLEKLRDWLKSICDLISDNVRNFFYDTDFIFWMTSAAGFSSFPILWSPGTRRLAAWLETVEAVHK